MRRSVGVSAIKIKQIDKEKFQEKGKLMTESRLSSVQKVVSKFQESLIDFSQKHRQKINSDPEFRQSFHAMCVSVGVDPLASNKGFWSEILGLGDFYYDLGIIIIQICLQTRAINGGIIPLLTLQERVIAQRQRHKTLQQQEINQADLMKAIEKLKVLGPAFRLIERPGRGEPYLLSVPVELNRDHEDLMAVAQDSGEGYVTLQMMRGLHGWGVERFQMAINPLLQEGIVWVDEFEGISSYYFPSMWQGLKSI